MLPQPPRPRGNSEVDARELTRWHDRLWRTLQIDKVDVLADDADLPTTVAKINELLAALKKSELLP